jgi:hypothetical protein
VKVPKQKTLAKKALIVLPKTIGTNGTKRFSGWASELSKLNPSQPKSMSLRYNHQQTKNPK